MSALRGVTVLDLTHLLPGPFCTMLLGDLGAEVIKVEEPGKGDPGRVLPVFSQVNRNKKSLTLNLKKEKGREVFYRLVEEADVVMEGFRPGVVERLGVDYDTVKAINPKVIYCSISGYGQDGPYRERPGHDINYLAMAGVLGLSTCADGSFGLPPVEIADLCSAMYAAFGVLCALWARQSTGEGQLVDVSMMDSAMSWTVMDAAAYLTSGVPPSGKELGLIPHYGAFRTRDGKYITLGIVQEDHFWAALCNIMMLEEWAAWRLPERVERRDEITQALTSKFMEKTIEEWDEILTRAGVPVAPLNSLCQALWNPQARAREMVTELHHGQGSSRYISFPIKLSRTPGTIRTPAPALGQHTSEVLSRIGYETGEIMRLRGGDVI